MSLYHYPRTKTQNSLKKEQTQNSPEPEVPLCSLMEICQLPLHTLQQCSTLVKNVCIQALDNTVHLCVGHLMQGC
jgi:hypothetical protein